MSGLFGSITVKGNRLTEFAQQTAAVGTPIPFGFGRFAVEGNVIFAPMPPKEHVKKKKQGKGGGVTTVTYTYTLSYAVAFCEGPIYGYWTIKRNGKVVWTQDPNATIEDQAYADKWAQKATFYYGTETQLPDSTIESYKGVGQVSAHRGIAYIVVEDDDVTDGGGAVPTYEAVVMASPPDLYLTSPPYPILASESMDHELPTMGPNIYEGFIDHVDHNLSITSGHLGEVLKQYSNNPPDELDHALSLNSASLVVTLVEYENNPPDELDHTLTISAASLVVTLITYSNNPPDELDHTLTIASGTLT